MIACNVKTKWHDMVGINEETYVKPAMDTAQSLQITLTGTGEVMLLTSRQVYMAQIARSEKKFQDKYGGPDYHLVYYKWVPTAKQGPLL